MSVRSDLFRQAFAEEAECADIKKRIDEALGIAVAYGGHEDWHKAWVIDQMVRLLCGTKERYQELVRDACDGEDGADSFKWDVGVPP